MDRLSKLEPVQVRSWIMAAIALLGGVGVNWASEDNAALLAGLAGAVLALVQGFITRPAVTPNGKVLAYVDNPERPNTTVIQAGEASVPASRSDLVVAAALEGGKGEADGNGRTY